MNDLFEYFENLLQYAQTNAQNLNAESQRALSQLIQQFSEIIQEMSQQQPEQPPNEPPPPEIGNPPSSDAQLLWILSGQQPQAFISYLRTFPTPGTSLLLSDPTLLNATIVQLQQMMPEGEQPVVDGIPHADLNSSNVWGANYDRQSGQMKVRFQGGSEYEYDGIPENIFRAFIKGNAAAKTKGRNQYGEWWPGKNPSMGAALNQYIKAGGFNYRRIR